MPTPPRGSALTMIAVIQSLSKNRSTCCRCSGMTSDAVAVTRPGVRSPGSSNVAHTSDPIRSNVAYLNRPDSGPLRPDLYISGTMPGTSTAASVPRSTLQRIVDISVPSLLPRHPYPNPTYTTGPEGKKFRIHGVLHSEKFGHRISPGTRTSPFHANVPCSFRNTGRCSL